MCRNRSRCASIGEPPKSHARQLRATVVSVYSLAKQTASIEVGSAPMRPLFMRANFSRTILNNQQCDYHQKKNFGKTWKTVIRALSISTSDHDEAWLHGPRYFLEFIHWLRSRGMPKSSVLVLRSWMMAERAALRS